MQICQYSCVLARNSINEFAVDHRYNILYYKMTVYDLFDIYVFITITITVLVVY